MLFNNLCFVGFYLLLLCITSGAFNKYDLSRLEFLECDEPSVTVHVFSGTPNPVWKISMEKLSAIKKVAYNTLYHSDNLTTLSKPTRRVMGYHGFTVSCSSDQYVFVNGLYPLEQFLLLTARSFLSTSIFNHVKDHLGEIMSQVTDISPVNADCNKVPIRGPDTVPKYDPSTDDDGCFISRQTENNCYAYGTDIVTNTFPQPGRGSGQKWSLNTCLDMGNASVRDGLIYYGTTLPTAPPSTGHYAALLIWPDTNFHWIRMDASGFWSHKPGGTPVRNTDNNDKQITDPSKADFAPWTQFCAYFIAQPSKLQIN